MVHIFDAEKGTPNILVTCTWKTSRLCINVLWATLQVLPRGPPHMSVTEPTS